ncbi:MAG: hypothetical protein AB7I38_12510 [Dehalococcoidia bacterium]
MAVPQPAPARTAAPLEERTAAVREPAAPPRPPRPPRRTSERTASAGATAQRAAGGAAAAASTAGARATAWSRTAAARARDGVVAAYRSPRTRNARTTVAEYASRTAAFVSYQTRRGSAYVREQYDLDARRTLIVAGIAAAAFLLLVVIAVSAIGGGDGDGAAGTDQSGGQAPALGTPLATGTGSGDGASPTTSPTPAAATAQPLPGTPYSEAAILVALRSRGLAANAAGDPFACDNPGTTPKSYRVSVNGAEQRIVLLVYPDAAAFSRDWAVGAGRPQYQNGNCAEGAAVVYFNVNVMLVFPETTNAGVQSQISDAFLALP